MRYKPYAIVNLNALREPIWQPHDFERGACLGFGAPHGRESMVSGGKTHGFCGKLQFRLGNSRVIHERLIRHPSGTHRAPIRHPRRGAMGQKARKTEVKSQVFQEMLVSPRDFDSWQHLWHSKTCNYPCVLRGSLRIVRKQKFRKISRNIENVLCFTALDAIPQFHKAHHPKRRTAETTVFYESNCDFSATQKLSLIHI